MEKQRFKISSFFSGLALFQGIIGIPLVLAILYFVFIKKDMEFKYGPIVGVFSIIAIGYWSCRNFINFKKYNSIELSFSTIGVSYGDNEIKWSDIRMIESFHGDVPIKFEPVFKITSKDDLIIEIPAIIQKSLEIRVLLSEKSKEFEIDNNLEESIK